MTSSLQVKIKPITDYVAIIAEMEYWKEKCCDLQEQISQLKATNKDKIIIKEGGQARYVRLSDITMMEAESNYTIIHLANGQKILTSKTLKYWMTQIEDHTDFFRPHRSYLVNKTYVVSYQRQSKCLFLPHGLVAQVARRHKIIK